MMLCDQGIVLGNHISNKGIGFDPTKVNVIVNVPRPRQKKDIRIFLGHVGYYRRFIKDFRKVSSLMFTLLTKDAKFQWTPECQQAFEIIKEKIMTTPVLQGPKWNLPFHIHLDASDKEIGVVLGQQEEKDPYVIYYISQNLVGPELNYTITKKEFLVVVHAFNKSRNYITGYQVIVHTYHVSIRYLMNKINVGSRVVRWILLLQEFDLTIMDKLGKHNVVVDFLSRLEHTTDQEMIEDAFPDEHLFSISTKISCFYDMENYFAIGNFPQHFSYREMANIVR